LQRRASLNATRDYGAFVSTLPLHPADVELRVVDFDRLTVADIAGADDIFCALGTTIKKAGSQAAFRNVDYDAIVNLARAGVEAGAKKFVLVSSIGADPSSGNFYLRVKGETEQAVSGLPFEAVHIMRPSLLLGRRDELRTGEGFAQAIMPMLSWALVGRMRKYRAIPADTIARAMVQVAGLPVTGVHVYDYDEIRKYSEGTR
jgi:uncharacterized protein YbjT (DUF2867 family)